MSNPNPPVTAVDEVSAHLRIPKASIHKLAQKVKIPAHNVGRHWRLHRDALERQLEAGDARLQAIEHTDPANA